MRVREVLQSLDWVLFGTAVLLTWLGLAIHLSAASADISLLSSRFVRQVVSLSIALALYCVVSFVPYHTIRRYTPILYLLGLAALAVVLQFGSIIRGTASRLALAGVQIQPSEFMKVILVVALAGIFAREQHPTVRTYLLSALLTGAVVALVLLEPDLGMAALITVLWAATVIFLGIPWRTVVLLGLVVAAGFAAAWLWLFADYQKERLQIFIDPTRDPLGAGYNFTQSIIALGSGQLFGRGLGQGPQSQLNFLPERHTDFMLASIGEELGFVGVLLVASLYAVLLWRMVRIACTTSDTFGQLLGVGAFLSILLSFFVSAGMNIGLLPVTGIPLPLISYGGSNLVSTFLLLGIVQSVRVHSRWTQTPPIELSHFT